MKIKSKVLAVLLALSFASIQAATIDPLGPPSPFGPAEAAQLAKQLIALQQMADTLAVAAAARKPIMDNAFNKKMIDLWGDVLSAQGKQNDAAQQMVNAENAANAARPMRTLGDAFVTEMLDRLDSVIATQKKVAEIDATLAPMRSAAYIDLDKGITQIVATPSPVAPAVTGTLGVPALPPSALAKPPVAPVVTGVTGTLGVPAAPPSVLAKPLVETPLKR